MNGGQRSNWLAGRVGIVGLGLMLIAAVVEFRPSSSEIRWRTYAEGVEEAKGTGKPIYVDLYATWCGPCKEMERVTFTHDSVRELLSSSYIPVRIDIDTRQYDDSLKARWNLKGVPTSLIVAARGSILGRRIGFQYPKEFVAWLSDPALLAYAGWLDYDAARRRSGEIHKPLLVIMTASPQNIEEIQRFFLEPRFRAFLQERFVVTRVTGEGSDEKAQYTNLSQMYSLTPTPKDGLVLLALGPDGRDLGQVPVAAEEMEDHERIMGLLRKYLKDGGVGALGKATTLHRTEAPGSGF
jgi:thiol-disulfide isomerase/thioredoxin